MVAARLLVALSHACKAVIPVSFVAMVSAHSNLSVTPGVVHIMHVAHDYP